jgi:hypothetical protein
MNYEKRLEALDKEINKSESKKGVHEKAFADAVNKVERLKIERRSVVEEMNRERNAAMIQVAEVHGINDADALAQVLESNRPAPAPPPKQPVNVSPDGDTDNEEDSD